MNEPQQRLGGLQVALMAVACGAMVANLYYAQTLIDRIGPEIGLSANLAGLITTLTQLGYGLGLAFLVPLGDRFANKRLTLIFTAGAIAGCVAIALSNGPLSFLAASLVTGICATGAQILVPLAAHLSADDRQGRVVGQVMSGLLAGIMLARPLASFVAEHLGWRVIFWGSAVLMAVIAVLIAVAVPERRPGTRIAYGETLRSMVGLVRRHRALRLRAAYQALLFAAFNLFWTAAPLALLHRYGFSQDDVALFALVGAGGALAAPLAGSLADRGHGWGVTLVALCLLPACLLLSIPALATAGIIGLALLGFLIDAAVQLNQVVGQKIVFSLSPPARARLNAAYMTIMFVVGATGSTIGSAAYAASGWSGAAMAGALIGALALALFLWRDRGASHTG